VRAAIEVEANCKAILAENGYVRIGRSGKPANQSNWNMTDYTKLEKTHQLSAYEIRLPVWRGAPISRKPFEQWATGNALPWWGAYNEAKHDRREKFAKASFSNLIDAICALVVILSAQFHTYDFLPGGSLIGWDESRPAGYEMAIGGYFLVKFPMWPPAEQYDFEWDPTKPGTFQRHTF
jgi:hypothetical protein